MLAYKGYEIWIRIRRYMLIIIFVTNKRKVYVKNKTLVEILKSYVRLIFKAYFYNIDIKKIIGISRRLHHFCISSVLPINQSVTSH
jgi:hypothetical protein